jgi:5'-3' exonuclease
MGIPYYVASLLRKHREIQKRYDSFDCDALAIDFNCFIHKVLDDADPIGSVVRALRAYIVKVRSERIYIAFDGLVPYAKIVQQRYRRFKISEQGVFDRNQISPGTQYMLDLETELRLQFSDIEISGTREYGEGEHKIFQWLRRLDPHDRTRIAIYGLDADLVLIALAQSSLGSIFLLRDDDAFSISALARALPLPVDEYVRKCILCFGNDFMPTLAMFSLREDGHARAMNTLLEKAADIEARVLVERKAVKTPHALEARHGLRLDGVLDWTPVVYAFWKTYLWTLEYFTTSEVPDWCWFYPYAEAPLVQTLVDLDSPLEVSWEYPEPTFGIDQQLAFILPNQGVYPNEFYNEDTDMRPLWMKKYVWESDPLISLPWDPARPFTYVTHVTPARSALLCKS